MSRVVGIDFGLKKTGIAATDPLQIIVNPVCTVPTAELHDYLVKYCSEEPVEKIVVGKPEHKDGTDTYVVAHIEKFIKKLSKVLTTVKFDYADEHLTSVQARAIILQSGVRKSKRRDKSLVDKISAVLILQRYLGHI